MKKVSGSLLVLTVLCLLLTGVRAEHTPAPYAILDVIDNAPAFSYQVLYIRPISRDAVEALVLAHAWNSDWHMTQSSFALADPADALYYADVLSTPGETYINEYTVTIPAGESRVLSFQIPYTAQESQNLRFVCLDAGNTATAFSYEPVSAFDGVPFTADMLALFESAQSLTQAAIIGGADGPTAIFLSSAEPSQAVPPSPRP